MKINTETLLFEDITPEEAADMQLWAEDCLLRGKLRSEEEDPPWIKAWFTMLGYTPTQRLLLQSTAFPQRVLLSLVHYLQRERANND
jgi:hypothetical protein